MDALLVVIVWAIVRLVVPVVLLISIGEWVRAANLRMYRR